MSQSARDKVKAFLPASVMCGLVGGASLVGAALAFGYGNEILIPLALLVLAMMLVVRYRRMRTFGAAFVFSGIAFLVALTGLYVGLVTLTPVSDLGVAGHAARLLLTGGFALAMAAPTAWLGRVASA